MDALTRRAIEAIDAAEREVAAMPPIPITEQHARDVETLMTLPENQNGADKSWLWRRFMFVRRHFQNIRPR